MLIILFYLMLILSILIFATCMTFLPNYKYYKQTYKLIENSDFIFCGKYFNDFHYVDKNNIPPSWIPLGPYHFYHNKNIVYYSEDRSIKLTNGFVLEARFLTWLDPYSTYWLIKFRKWFDENKGIDDVSLKRNDSIVKLLK